MFIYMSGPLLSSCGMKLPICNDMLVVYVLLITTLWFKPAH